MKKLRDVLRLHFDCQLSNRKIARALGISATTVGSYIKSAQNTPLSWEEIQSLNDTELMACLENHCTQLKPKPAKYSIDLGHVHQQLKHKGVTRELLHEEYLKTAPPSARISYSEFCRQYRLFKKTLKPSMRQQHGGHKNVRRLCGPQGTDS